MSTFTQRELEISNKSYTNKDFEAIYLELLSTAEKISTRFSPTSANEADPFIILLKLVAATADKINYNVDKNVLERFLLSCTQEKSMRELTEMLGYKMKYYNSAETSVVFKFNFNSLEGSEAEEIDEIEIPAYSIITDGDSIQYITTENATISKNEGVSREVAIIQGKLKELTVLGSSIIQLENLNANNRLYLPEVMIAENGVSVNNTSSANAWKSWTASDNLNTETYGTLVYKFGFDSVKNLPYLDFPDWISEIIGDGLSVKYLITDGSAGNIGAKGLITVSRSNASDGIDDALIGVINASAATSGCEPETLAQSYKGFKKIIGTFDTLVTCRDYANKIYTLLNSYGNPYVSNVQVGDRRTDINYACEVITASDFGSQAKSTISYKYDVMCRSDDPVLQNLSATTENFVYYLYDQNKYYKCKYIPPFGDELDGHYALLELTEAELHHVIDPYDINIYGLKNIANTTYLGVDDANGYNMAYTMLTDTTQLNAIKNHLSNCKTMPHIYKDLKSSDIGFIRNDYKLHATINTAQKVNILEQSEILININNALIKKYNPRNLSFGSEIAFDELLDTIEKADSRIKSVSLQEPEQTPMIVMANNQEVSLFDTDGNATDQFKFIIAKNILSGRVEVFNYDKDFAYGYTQQDARKYLNLMKAITECNIEAFPENKAENDTESALDVETNYILNNNETIQFLAPTFKTEVTYPYGVNYFLKLNPGKTFIPKDAEYKLSSGEELIISYINNNDETIVIAHKGSDPKAHIIKPNFDFYTCAHKMEAKETPTKIGIANTEYNSEAYPFYTFSSSQEVEYKTYVSDNLTIVRRCYWLTNQVNNRINWIKEEGVGKENYYTYILDDGEYFFYSDSNLTSLFAFGSGTKLKLYAENANNVFDNLDRSIWTHSNYIDVDTITEQGLSSLGDYFITKVFNTTNFNLEIYENEIITLTTGDTLKVKNLSGESFTIPNNNFTTLPENVSIQYKFEGEEEEFTTLPDRSTLGIDDAAWKCRSVLDLNVGPNSPQTLVGNQKITFIPGSYDRISRRWIAFTDISDKYVNGNIILSASSNSTFESTVALIRGGGANVNLEYMDLDLTYKCPSILIFNDVSESSNITALGEGYFSTNFSSQATVETPVDDTCSASGSCTLYTAAADAKVIAAETLNDNALPSLANPASNNNIERYFNNKYYYHVSDNSYYKCVYDDISDLKVTDISKHNIEDLSIHTFRWEKANSITPSPRLVMIYLNNLDGSADNILGINVINKTVTLTTKNNSILIRKYNEVTDIDRPSVFTNSITLSQGINVIEISDTVSATANSVETNYCDYLVATAVATVEKDLEYEAEDGTIIDDEALKNAAKTALASISVLLSKLKLNKGINPNLGLLPTDDILNYIKKNFNNQFKNFFINAEFDQAKIINISENYPLSCAQAFYDSNNIARNWVMSKIDFPSSSISIARSSKK